MWKEKEKKNVFSKLRHKPDKEAAQAFVVKVDKKVVVLISQLFRCANEDVVHQVTNRRCVAHNLPVDDPAFYWNAILLENDSEKLQ